MTETDQLWEAKVQVMAGLASGPVMLIENEEERALRFFEMMSLLETEHADHYRAPVAKPAPAPRATRTSSNRVDWSDLIERCQTRANHTEQVHYRSHLTASATVTKLRDRYRPQFPTLQVWSAKDETGDGGSVYVALG